MEANDREIQFGSQGQAMRRNRWWSRGGASIAAAGFYFLLIGLFGPTLTSPRPMHYRVDRVEEGWRAVKAGATSGSENEAFLWTSPIRVGSPFLPFDLLIYRRPKLQVLIRDGGSIESVSDQQALASAVIHAYLELSTSEPFRPLPSWAQESPELSLSADHRYLQATYEAMDFRWYWIGLPLNLLALAVTFAIYRGVRQAADSAWWRRKLQKEEWCMSHEICPTCRYDLRGAEHVRCPECGNAVPWNHGPND